MKRLCSLTAPVILMVIGLSCASEDAQPPAAPPAGGSANAGTEGTAQDLKDIGAYIVGRWIGNVTWAVDYPGVGKKGETVTAYYTCAWAVDGNAIQCEFSGGQAIGRALFWWDATSKQVRVFGLDSGNNWDQGTVATQGNKVVGQTAGGFPDGRRVEYRWEWTFEDGGNGFVSSGTTILDGAESPFRDVFRRVSK